MITRNKLEQLVLDCLNELLMIYKPVDTLAVSGDIFTYTWIEIVNSELIRCNSEDFERITGRILSENNLSYKQKIIFFNLVKMYTRIE